MTKLSYGEMFALIFNGKKPQIVYIYCLLHVYLGVTNHAGPLCLLNCLKGRSIDRMFLIRVIDCD